VAELESAATACARAEACRNATKADCKDNTRQLRLFALECYQLRSTFSKNIRVIAPNNNTEITLPWYSRKNSYGDIVQDLFDLSRYCEKNRETQ
jgi:hypothetical protein